MRVIIQGETRTCWVWRRWAAQGEFGRTVVSGTPRRSSPRLRDARVCAGGCVAGGGRAAGGAAARAGLWQPAGPHAHHAGPAGQAGVWTLLVQVRWARCRSLSTRSACCPPRVSLLPRSLPSNTACPLVDVFAPLGVLCPVGCRFPNGESGADVYDRLTIFEDHLTRDMLAGRFCGMSLVLVTHGLTLRLFLMRWFHWSVDEFLGERLHLPGRARAGATLTLPWGASRVPLTAADGRAASHQRGRQSGRTRAGCAHASLCARASPNVGVCVGVCGCVWACPPAEVYNPPNCQPVVLEKLPWRAVQELQGKR